MAERLLGLTEAANYLNCHPTTLRRLVARSRRCIQGIPTLGPTIRFCQSRSYATIHFRREWLDSYIDACTHSPEVCTLVRHKSYPALQSAPLAISAAFLS